MRKIYKSPITIYKVVAIKYSTMKQIVKILFIIAIFTGCNNNSDNTIYIPGRIFNFQVNYTNSVGELTKIQKLDLHVTNGFYPERKQTQIIWKLFDAINSDSIIATDKTGVIDGDDVDFFIHQPRIKDMYILSFAEFPSIGKNVISDSTLVRITEGEVVMAKSYKGTRITKVKTKQKYCGKTSVTLAGIGNRRVHYLDASAISKIGTIKGDYYFDEELGFVKLDFTLPDSSAILMELTGTNFMEK